MSTKLVIFLSVLLTPLSLLSQDSNLTLIMNEATNATQELQKQINEELNTSEEIPKPIEMNNTILTPSEVIEINETKEPQEKISDEFNSSEVNLTTKTEELQENNLTLESNLTEEINTVIENNISLEVNTTIKVEELNTTNRSLCVEQNISQENNESNLTTEAPSTACSEQEEEGSVMRGIIIFKTRIKPFCEITGEEFAKKYIQEDWDEIYHDKEFKQEVIKACPNIEKRYKDKWTPHLYQFSLEYASDSDAIPEC